MAEAPTAYLSYVEVVRASATKLCAVHTREIAVQKFRQTRRQGVTAPMAYFAYVEVRARPTTTYGGIYACEGARSRPPLRHVP